MGEDRNAVTRLIGAAGEIMERRSSDMPARQLAGRLLCEAQALANADAELARRELQGLNVIAARKDIARTLSEMAEALEAVRDGSCSAVSAVLQERLEILRMKLQMDGLVTDADRHLDDEGADFTSGQERSGIPRLELERASERSEHAVPQLRLDRSERSEAYVPQLRLDRTERPETAVPQLRLDRTEKPETAVPQLRLDRTERPEPGIPQLRTEGIPCREVPAETAAESERDSGIPRLTL